MKDLLTHRRGLALLAAVFLAFVAVQVARLWLEPGAPNSVDFFQRAYPLAPDKAAFLAVYATQLDVGNDGFIPPEIDCFLSRRFGAARSEPERRAIVDFLVGREAAYRAAFSFVRCAEPVAAVALARLEGYDRTARAAALRLIEGLRRGRPLYQAAIAEVQDGERTLRDAVDAYRHWWAGEGDWAARRERDPLAHWARGWRESAG
jgi:hypothetical protein